MIELKLSAEEAAALRDVLREYLSDLRMEISATDIMDFREKLKAKERALEKILGELPKTT
ncbi:MAG: hypothetical protein WAO20_22295 [Acidobacteriota bacterium]